MEPVFERLLGTGIFPTLHYIVISQAPQTIAVLHTLKSFFLTIRKTNLALFIINQSTLGLALTRFEGRALAGRMASSSPDGPPLGKRWFSSFLAHHPEIRSRKNQRVEAKRLRVSSKTNIGPWFDLLELSIVKEIKPDNRWNADEGGLMEGISENSLTLGYSKDSPLSQKDFNSRAWTSFMECINAMGKSHAPLIILKGLSVQQQWFQIALEDHDCWQFTATKMGWIEEKIAIKWLRRIFIPMSAPEDPKEWRLLVIDGHYTHITIDFMWECFSNKVYIVFLPAYTSHILQPLDVGAFSPLKNAVRKHLHQLGQYDSSTVMAKKRFLFCYHKAGMEALTGANIRSGWRAADLWPVSRVRALGNHHILENHQN
jgi:4-hydroxybenzoate polyprenyltransferase